MHDISARAEDAENVCEVCDSCMSRVWVCGCMTCPKACCTTCCFSKQNVQHLYPLRASAVPARCSRSRVLWQDLQVVRYEAGQAFAAHMDSTPRSAAEGYDSPPSQALQLDYCLPILCA